MVSPTDDFGRAVSRILSASLILKSTAEEWLVVDFRMSEGENHLSLQPIPGTDPALSEPRSQRLRASERAGEERAAPRFPIWPCTRWGFPCLRAYAWSGGLLPHLFTLTTVHASMARAVCFLWHYPSGRLTASPPACIQKPLLGLRLRGIAPFGVRTFLPPAKCRRAILRPSKIERIIATETRQSNLAL